MKTILLLGATLLLAACTIRPHPIEITPYGVEIGRDGGGGGGFCPPGQAKKGNC